MAELEDKYADRPVHFFHVMCGENLIQALDFKKHYRSHAPHLLDTTYAVSEAYQAGSWPTTVLIDAEGKIAGRWPMVSDPANYSAAHALLEDLLEKAKGGPPKGAYCVGDKCFVRTSRHVFESQPAMVADGQGRLHLVFVRDQGGSGDLFHRILENGNWSEPERVTRSAGDDYSPALCADGERGLRLVWCSDRAASGKYDVWTARFDGARWAAAERVTETDDDAAHPRPAIDKQGNFWVTYYQWIPWRKGVSRDREIFVRFHDGKSWSDPRQISPTDVPAYEDHADPAIAADDAGNVWVAWSWDTHPEDGTWQYPPTYGPSVFARQLRAHQPLSQLQFVGVRARSLRAAKSSPRWAFTPEIHCRGDRPWFMFESHVPGRDHTCSVVQYDPEEGFPAPTLFGFDETYVCSPRLLADRRHNLLALWAAPDKSKFAVHIALLGADGAWGEERRVWPDPEADLRQAVGAFDRENNLWLAATRIELGKSTVVTRKVPLDSSGPLSRGKNP